MRYYYIIIFVVEIALLSCTNISDTKKHLTLIDSLKIKLEKSATEFEQTDTVPIHNALIEIEEQINHLNKQSNININKTVISSGIIKTAFEDFLNAKPEILDELKYTRSQLNDLEYDIKKHQLNEDLANQYLEQEKQSVFVLVLKMDYYRKLVESNQQNYIALQDELNTSTESER